MIAYPGEGTQPERAQAQQPPAGESQAGRPADPGTGRQDLLGENHQGEGRHRQQIHQPQREQENKQQPRQKTPWASPIRKAPA